MRLSREDKTFAEFFAGIGLVACGLEPGGWRCIYANDIAPRKQAMYVDRFGPSPHYQVEDVWNTDAVLQVLPPRPFLATASFPCIDLSLAGHWRGFAGEHSSTYFGFLQVLQRMKGGRPKLIQLENVYGFLTANDGDDFVKAIRGLAELGYWIDALVLDADWFVPQSRPRLFVFGFHETLMPSELLLQRESRFNLDDPWRRAVHHAPPLRPRRLMEAMETISLPTGWATLPLSAPSRRAYRLVDFLDLDDGQDWWPSPQVRGHLDMMEAPSRQRVDELLKARETTVGTAFRRTRRAKMRLEVRFDMAGCLRTPRGGSAKQIIVAIQQGRLKMRWMSAREYARLQGVPDFPISVPPLQAMYGFGDAVCVPVIRWIDENILTPVFEESTKPVGSSMQTAVA